MSAHLPAALGGAALVLWVVFEFAVRPPQAGGPSPPAGGKDRGSTLVLVAAYVGAYVVLMWLPHVAALPATVAWAGVVVAFLGLGLRAWAMRVLGVSYRRTLRTEGDQELVTAGPYRVVRHPGYAGSLAVWLGYAASRGGGLALAVVALWMLAAYLWRMRAEEKMLVGRFGSAYEAYMARTKRLIPGVY